MKDCIKISNVVYSTDQNFKPKITFNCELDIENILDYSYLVDSDKLKESIGDFFMSILEEKNEMYKKMIKENGITFGFAEIEIE